MAHKAELANVKYRNWVKAGLGIKYVKEGLEPFCDHLATQQHIDILNKVKMSHSLSAVACGHCDVRTLQPNHVRTRTKQCPLDQIKCNCQRPGWKKLCPNNVCGAIYDEIIQLHASTPPAPYWKNTDARQWCTEPWSVAKCFINAPGYDKKTKAYEFDCPGLLHVLINNKGFQRHIKCKISGTDVFTRVRKSRNDIFHSNSMELEDTEVNGYIDDMIELLEDEQEIKHTPESKDAVKKLQELKHEDFIISTTDEAEIRRVAMAAINEKEKELEQMIVDAGNKLRTTVDEGKHDIEGKGSVIKAELNQTGQKISKELVMKEAELEQTGQNIKKDLAMKEAELEQTGQKIIKEVVMKEAELEQTGQKIRKDLAMKEAELEQTGQKIIKEVVMKEAELEQTGHRIKKELVIKEEESKLKIEQKGIDIEKQATEKLEQKLKEAELQLESHKNLIEGSMTNTAETTKEAVTNSEKTDLQMKLVKLYEIHIRKIVPLPRLHKDRRNVSEMYVPPWMTVEVKKEASDEKNEESNEWEEVKISMDEIFRNKERSAKNIYVIGEAGTGKTTFCKMLVHFWVIAHQYQEYSLDVPDIVKEMKHFKFLFYISLRHFSDCDSIENMLKKSYSDPALRDILRNDSSACLIILDGLDEWDPERKHISQFLTPGLPGRELDTDYTIITTSRQWKFDALPLSCIEVDKKIKLNGIDRYEIKKFTKKTIETLNDIYQKSKNAEECITDLRSRQVSDISHTPLVLQQLISLWFHNKLKDNSKCAIYRSMLDLFLEWKTLGTSESQDQLYAINTTSRNTHVTKYLSYLAYETLFDKNKETTLTFSSSTLTQLNIPRDVIKDCLVSGILKEERNVSLTESIQSSISFFHKSMQEYLAAVYIASQFREMLKSQKDEHDLKDVCEKCVRKYFGSCKTVVDILEQSTVLIILCGLEPRLLTNISEYFYNITIVDKMVVKGRRQMSLDHRTLINNIQAFILKCIEAAMSITQNARLRVYIADLYVDPSTGLLSYVHNIVFENVLSIEIVDSLSSLIPPLSYKKDDHKEKFYCAVKHLVKCDQLKVIKFTLQRGINERIKNEVTTILETNVRTLETIHLGITDNDIIMITRLVSMLPKMRQLISLQMDSGPFGRSGLTHDDSVSLCKFLEQTTSLQHISLGISCSKRDYHMIDLAKHKQLQHVDFFSSSFSMVSCNTDNLETCKLNITSADTMKQVCNNLYKADKLKHLELECYFICSDETNTESLTRLLLSLVSLSTLTLENFTFTDNIIARPCDMKNLKKITLRSVTMSMTTWYKFIDSLPALPLVVTVTTRRMDIRDIYSMPDKKQEASAYQYVREKTNLFRVPKEYILCFQFITKKL
ncbi:uncharacterized protein LOC128549108 [Mercenaria mercenaria]|uniref:uncharacterized protein LOC128549108 n=1 Tax=Mercenaria mercenaria TaxID=6596 RepID=UPI00234F301D|nr:uncharacterized protein LOC128549108 [Mercenaria mercenaria]